MKKYILFFISIGLIVTTFLIYSTINVEEGRKIVFDESGYILNGSKERYYFQQNGTYTTSYNDQIVFYDTEGEKVTLDNSNFIHYSSGNIEALQEGVLLDLSKINDNPIIYYNVSANKEIKKISNRYTVKNLNDDLQFEQAIWKISPTKYIVLADKIIVTLNNGTKKEIEGYIEIEYFDNEIVSLYNQEISYQTISSNSYIELENNIKINLGTKIVSLNEENKMALEDMVINSDDNVTLVDLNTVPDVMVAEEEENEENEEKEETSEKEGTTVSSTSTSTSSSTTNSSSAVVGTNTNGQNEEDNNKIVIETPDILYEYVSDNENKVDESLALEEPTFKFENMSVTATGIDATIQITDDDDLLSKNDDVIIKIINNTTGKIVYTTEEPSGVYKIPLDIQTLLPDTSYTVMASATYILDETSYTKTFLYKTFVTSSIGVSIEKESYTDSSLAFDIKFNDELVKSVEVTLLDSQGNELANRNQEVKNAGSVEQVEFSGLNSNTNYIVRVSKINYNGVIQEGENWKIEKECQTLKQKATIDNLNYSINKRDGTFTLYIDGITDPNAAIQSYKYVIYKYTQLQKEDGSYYLDYDTENIAYQRETTGKEITITVADETSGENIVRGQYYGFKVIATTYDNEKYVEVESSICGAFVLNGAEFPTVKFERLESDYPPTEIRGWLYIIDNENTITVNEDNPLTITYYSDVDEGKVYIKRTSLQTDERTTDTSGNSVIKIWIDLGERGSSKKGLKAETSYTFAVYGTIDLKDGNGDHENAHIGSAIVTTKSYETLTANLATVSSASNTFTVELSLSGSEVAKESLSSVSIMLYEGSGDINVGEYNNWTRTITTSNYGLSADNVKYDTEVESLQDLLFDNTLVITPSFIGGGKESSYTEANYQVVVTATVDGTNYSNKIPIEAADDNNEDTGDTTYTNESTNETYTAAYIIVDGKGTTAEVTEELAKIKAIGIENQEANTYNLEKKDDLLDSTYVGYYVSTDFLNTGSLTAKEITYYVWDENKNAVLDGNGNQITQTIKFTNQNKAPSAVFELEYGTNNNKTEDNQNGLHRGCAYYFSYTVTYVDAMDTSIIWPICESNDTTNYNEKSLNTGIVWVSKQEPNFVVYPKTSNEETLTYIYSCNDPDKALYYTTPEGIEYANLTLKANGEVRNSNIEIIADGIQHELTINNLVINTNYGLFYVRNLNKVKSSQYQQQELIKLKFEGIVECNNVRISNINYNDPTDPNNIKIYLTGDNVSRIASAVVTLKNGNEEMTTDLIKLNTTNTGSYINVSLLDLSKYRNFEDFIGIDIEIKVTAYYDNGRIGFIPDVTGKYSTYVDADNNYMKLTNGNLVADTSISGNMFEYSFMTYDTMAQLVLKDLNKINSNSNGTVLELLYSQSGLKQKEKSIVQKQISSVLIDETTTHTINIDSIVLGLKVEDIKTTLSTANIKTSIVNPINIEPEEFVVELWHSANKNDTPDWSNCEIREVETSDITEFELNELAPSEYYYMRFKYIQGSEYVYTYDIDSKEAEAVYEFETLATIGITELNVEYEAENYMKKYIDITYNINSQRSTMFEKVQYTFYEANGETKVNLTEQNIFQNNEHSNYAIVDGALEVTNPQYPGGAEYESIYERIKISPADNVFTIGKDYILVVTPIVTANGGTEKYKIENVEKRFNLENLKEPSVGLKMVRKTTSDDESKQYIRIRTTIKDTDKIIYGSDYGEYELHVYKYKTDRSSATEVDIYSKYQGGTNITGRTFNLNEHASNYSAYIQTADIDYSYNYVVELTLKYDRMNIGSQLEEHTVQYTLSAINNESNISIGTATVVENNENVEVHFYDNYYNIDEIDKIDYTIIELSKEYNQTGTFEPKWTLVIDNETGIAYYKITLSEQLTEAGVYTIQMNFYSDDTLVEQLNTIYIKK